MLRYFNRVNSMESWRLPKLIYDWDVSLGLDSWGSEIKHIAANLGFDTTLEHGESYDLTLAYNKFLVQSRREWQIEAERKPKLRTFLKIHNFDSKQCLVKSQITRYQRSLLSQLKFGILPLKIETDRYQGIPLENRLCRICSENTVEDEIHFLFSCSALSSVRTKIMSLFDNTNVDFNESCAFNKLHNMLSQTNLVSTGKYIEALYRERQRLVYK